MHSRKVEKGAAWLDKHIPDWYTRIKGDFHFRTSILSVLFPKYSDFLDFNKTTGLSYSKGETLGLVSDYSYTRFQIAEWKKQVGLRLHKDQHPEPKPLGPLQFRKEPGGVPHEISFMYLGNITSAYITKLPETFIVAAAQAACSEEDNFSKEQGRVIALVRALEKVHPEHWSTILSTYYGRKR